MKLFKCRKLDGDILDVGCGYGPIGLTVAKTWPDRTVHMIDVNKRALQLAKDNSELNGIQNVNVYESDRLDAVNEHKFAAILTNPLFEQEKRLFMKFMNKAIRSFTEWRIMGCYSKETRCTFCY